MSEDLLHITALVFVRPLANGRVVIGPIAERALAVAGSPDAAAEELRTHLASTLASAPADHVARYVLTDASARDPRYPSRLAQTAVDLSRADLPRRFDVDVPVSVSSVVIPVPQEDEKREEANVDRWVLLLPFGYTFFLRGGEDLDEAVARESKRLVVAHQLTAGEWLDVLPRPKEALSALAMRVDRVGAAEKAEAKAKARVAAAKKKHALEVLDAVGRRVKPLPRIHGREAEIRSVRALLRGERRQSILLAGPPRCGKTSILRAALAEDALVFATSGADIVAGMGGFGQWQERLRRVLDAAHELDAVLLFGDLGDLLADHAGWVDVPSAMKPWLDESRVRVVAEISRDLDRAEARAPGFLSCFVRVRVQPASADETIELLRARIAADRDDELPKVKEPETIVDLAERYLPYQTQPGKSVQLYEDVRSAAALRAGSEAAKVTLGRTDILSDFAVRTGIPEVLLREDLRLATDDVDRRLSKRVIGQDEAKRSLARVICSVKANLQPRGKPLGTLFFVGPTGVGKTELARALAEELFGNAERLVRVDMSELSTAHSATRLFGAEGSLTRTIRDRSFAVVLLDEIEKAHPDVFDVLLQITGEGRLTDERGRITHFDNTVLVLTSNLGAAHRRPRVGFGDTAFDAKAHYERAIAEAFRPELVNRLDRVIVFEPLSRDEVHRVVENVLARLAKRRGIGDSGRTLDVSPEVVAKLAEDGASEAYGARAVRRHIERTIATPIAELLSKPGNAGPGAIRVMLEGGAFRFAFEPCAPKKYARASEASSEVRREIQSALRWEPIRRLREQVDFLRVELSYGPRSGARSAHDQTDISLLLAEHHRLAGPLEALDKVYEEVVAIEDVDLAAQIAGVEVTSDVAPHAASFRNAAVEAVFALDTCKESIAFLLQELDNTRMLDLVLPALVRECQAREWRIALHTDRGESGMSERKLGRWTDPRALEDIVYPHRSATAVLVILAGKHAGSFFSREAGLHELHGWKSETSAMFHTPVAKTGVLTPAEWQSPDLAPLPPNEVAARKKQKPVRKWMYRDGTVAILERVEIACAIEDGFRRFEEIAYAHEREIQTDPSCAPEISAIFSSRLDPVLRALRSGNKIQAIKLYREATGVSLKEAKDAVDSMELSR